MGNLITKEVTRKEKILIKPDGWTIPKEKFWIDNGYTTEENQRSGVPMQEALPKIIADMHQCRVISAHNLPGFDRPILGAEMVRYKMNYDGPKLHSVCTMLASTQLCKLPPKNPKGRGYKWPSLIELHTFLFGVGFDGANDAEEDATAGIRSLFELVDRGVIEIPELNKS